MTVFIRKIYLYVNFFLKRIYDGFIFLRFSLFKKPQKKIETVTDATNNYIIKNRRKFLDIFNEDNLSKWNTNMDTIIYSKKEYAKTLENENNVYEKKWKTRILFETTPKGNIVMHYDIYKQGFTYYSDMTGIDYHLLNSVAMKYVLTYRCLDFFVDDEITPTDRCSPLIKLYNVENGNADNEDAADKTDEQKQKDDDLKAILKDGPYIKYKKSTVTRPTQQDEKQRGIMNKKSSTLLKENFEKSKNEKEFTRNRFISGGKIMNMNFIQKTETQKKNTQNLTKASHNKMFNYSDYKKEFAVALEQEKTKENTIL